MALELWIRRSTYDRLIALCDPDTQEYRWLKDSYFERETLMSIEESFFCHAVFRRAEIAVKVYMGRDFAERFFHFGCFDRFQHRHDGWRRVQMYTGAVIGAQPFATEVNS